MQMTTRSDDSTKEMQHTDDNATTKTATTITTPFLKPAIITFVSKPFARQPKNEASASSISASLYRSNNLKQHLRSNTAT